MKTKVIKNEFFLLSAFSIINYKIDEENFPKQNKYFFYFSAQIFLRQLNVQYFAQNDNFVVQQCLMH